MDASIEVDRQFMVAFTQLQKAQEHLQDKSTWEKGIAFKTHPLSTVPLSWRCLAPDYSDRLPEARFTTRYASQALWKIDQHLTQNAALCKWSMTDRIWCCSPKALIILLEARCHDIKALELYFTIKIAFSLHRMAGHNKVASLVRSPRLRSLSPSMPVAWSRWSCIYQGPIPRSAALRLQISSKSS